MTHASGRTAMEEGAASLGWIEHLARKLVIMASGSVASIVFGLALSVLVARLLGPERLASYATVTVACLLLAQLSDLGLANSFAYYARHRPDALYTLLGILGRHLVFSFGVTVAVVGLAKTVGGSALHGALSPGWFGGVVVVFVTVGTASNVLPVLVLARGHYRAYVIFTTLSTGLNLIAVLIVAALVGPSWRGFITGLTGANVVVVISELWYLRRIAKRPVEVGVTSRECYIYGLRIKWAEVMKLLSGRIDILVIAAILPAAQVGAYSVLSSFRELGMTPLRTYTGILQNLLVDRNRAHADDRDLVIGSLLVQALVSALLAVAVAIALPVMLPLVYGARYDVGGPAAVMFSSTIFLSVAGLSWTVFNMWGRPELTSRIVTLSGLSGPVIVWAFTKQAGLYGAAMAALANGVIVCLVSILALLRLRGYTGGDLLAVVRRVPALLRDFRMAARTSARGIVAGSSVGQS